MVIVIRGMERGIIMSKKEQACEPVKHTSTKHLVSMFCEATIQY